METQDARLKRMRMRSWRRGTKEMDLVLGPFADARLESLSEADLLTYDAILNENDQDLYPWITARLGDTRPGPQELLPLLDRIAAFARARLAK